MTTAKFAQDFKLLDMHFSSLSMEFCRVFICPLSRSLVLFSGIKFGCVNFAYFILSIDYLQINFFVCNINSPLQVF